MQPRDRQPRLSVEVVAVEGGVEIVAEQAVMTLRGFPAVVIVNVRGADRAPPPEVSAAYARRRLGVVQNASSSQTTSVGE